MPAGGKESVFRYKQDIRKAERRIKDGQFALGIRAYELFKEGAIQSPVLDEVVSEIDSAKEEIASCDEAIERIKREKAEVKSQACPHCGARASSKSKFCPSCGKDMGEGKVVTGIVCGSCGEAVDGDALFCEFCGGKVEKVEPTAGKAVQPEPTAQGSKVTQQKEYEDYKDYGNAPKKAPEDLVSAERKVETVEEPGNQKAPVGAEIEPVQPKKVSCPYCGDDVEIGSVFCISCGKTISW